MKLICLEFGVNQEWLQNGVGDIFISKELAQTPEEKELLSIFRRLTAEMRDFFLNMGRELVEKTDKKRQFKQEDGEKTEKAG